MQTQTEKLTEKIYVIQPITEKNASDYRTLHEEAVSLIESAGALHAGSIFQNVREINPATFIGEGKLQELKERLEGLDDLTVLFNGDLSPSQTLNISAALDHRKVIDRTTLILDIFAKNARSSEGKIQVELAQLRYLYPRLKAVKTIALVGYTNTGKSTLMNLLTGADVYVKNELFATLDPTARTFRIDGAEFLLVDTVGFLQDLPHHLVEAFKSTLESALNCDLALIVCDATGEYEMQLQTTLRTLEDLNFSAPSLVVMNKSEHIADQTAFPFGSVAISAKENIGIQTLKREILRKFDEDYLFCELFVPYEKFGEYGKIKSCLTERNVTFTDAGQTVEAVIPSMYAEKFTEYIRERHSV